MSSRRRFLQSSLMAAGAAMLPAARALPASPGAKVVSTWDFGVPANREAWQVLAAGGNALDAVEAGAEVLPECLLRGHEQHVAVSAVVELVTYAFLHAGGGHRAAHVIV